MWNARLMMGLFRDASQHRLIYGQRQLGLAYIVQPRVGPGNYE